MRKNNSHLPWTFLSGFLVLSVIATAGCATTSSMMQIVPEGEQIPPPTAGKTMLVFMRPSMFSFGLQAKIIDVTNEDAPKLVGIVGSKTKVAYETDPGESLFMILGGEGTPFFKANMDPDKTYYALVESQLGTWKNSFLLFGVTKKGLDSDDFDKWYSACTLIRNSEASYLWVEENMDKIRKHLAEDFPEWQEKTRDLKNLFILDPEDGR